MSAVCIRSTIQSLGHMSSEDGTAITRRERCQHLSAPANRCDAEHSHPAEGQRVAFARSARKHRRPRAHSRIGHCNPFLRHSASRRASARSRAAATLLVSRAAGAADAAATVAVGASPAAAEASASTPGRARRAASNVRSRSSAGASQSGSTAVTRRSVGRGASASSRYTSHGGSRPSSSSAMRAASGATLLHGRQWRYWCGAQATALVLSLY